MDEKCKATFRKIARSQIQEDPVEPISNSEPAFRSESDDDFVRDPDFEF